VRSLAARRRHTCGLAVELLLALLSLPSLLSLLTAECRCSDTSYVKQKKSHMPLVVKVGVGKLIAGWDAAIMSMSVGEQATIQIPAEHAYGKKGRPPTIPPNADLVFSVELLNIMD